LRSGSGSEVLSGKAHKTGIGRILEMELGTAVRTKHIHDSDRLKGRPNCLPLISVVAQGVIIVEPERLMEDLN
jgi:hypothetical protein